MVELAGVGRLQFHYCTYCMLANYTQELIPVYSSKSFINNGKVADAQPLHAAGISKAK